MRGWHLRMLSSGFRVRVRRTSRSLFELSPGGQSANSRSRTAGSASVTSMIFIRLVAPDTRVTACVRTPNAAATAVNAAAVACPFTARWLTRTIRAPLCSPPTLTRVEAGWTQMVIRTAPVCSKPAHADERRSRAPQLGRAGPSGDDERPHLYGEPMTSVKQFQVTFDCAEPERVARFWCDVLGYVVPPPPEGFATWGDFDRALPPERQGSAFACVDPTGVGPRLFFQRVPEGKVVKNRVHLDVRVGTGLVGEERLAALEAECARLVPLGAVRVRLLPADGDEESCLVMQDIEGNEFCLD